MSQKEIISEKRFSMLEKQAVKVVGRTNEFYKPRTVCIGFDDDGNEIIMLLNPLLKGDMVSYHDIELELASGYLIEKVEKEYFMGMDTMGYAKYRREIVCYLEKKIDFEFEEKARLQGFTDY